ncbi:MAG TPA: hypothetical protein VL049_16095, partial [Candidatus Dormibacteraeota bacterium]|nr:hypothetical protein [Candidatus Dormibacteraeota bacterium]
MRILTTNRFATLLPAFALLVGLLLARPVLAQVNTPTDTPTDTPTSTVTATATDTPTASATATNTPTVTSTATVTNTPQIVQINLGSGSGATGGTVAINASLVTAGLQVAGAGNDITFDNTALSLNIAN